MAKTYAEKLKSPKWQKVRLKIMERDDFKCTLCQDKETTLHVHHEEYNGNPWEANPDKLKTLCEHCHTCVEVAKNEIRSDIISSEKLTHEEYGVVAVLLKQKTGIIIIDVLTKTVMVSLSNHTVERIYNLSKETHGKKVL